MHHPRQTESHQSKGPRIIPITSCIQSIFYIERNVWLQRETKIAIWIKKQHMYKLTSIPCSTFRNVYAIPPPIIISFTLSNMLDISWILSFTLALNNQNQYNRLPQFSNQSSNIIWKHQWVKLGVYFLGMQYKFQSHRTFLAANVSQELSTAQLMWITHCRYVASKFVLHSHWQKGWTRLYWEGLSVCVLSLVASALSVICEQQWWYNMPYFAEAMVSGYSYLLTRDETRQNYGFETIPGVRGILTSSSPTWSARRGGDFEEFSKNRKGRIALVQECFQRRLWWPWPLQYDPADCVRSNVKIVSLPSK